MVCKLSRFKSLLLSFGMVLFLVSCDSTEEKVTGYYERGLKLIEADKPQQAALEFMNALQLDETHTSARFELSKLLYEKQDLKSVAGHLLKIVELKPDHVEAQTMLAQLFLMSGNLDDAFSHSEAAYRFAPEDPDVLALRAAVALRLENLDAALASAEAAVLKDPSSVPGGVSLAAYHLRDGAPTKALAIIEQTIERNQEEMVLHWMKLQILAQIGDPSAVTSYLAELTNLHPEDTLIRSAYVEQLMSTGDLSKAKEELETLAAGNPNNSKYVLDLVRFLYATEGYDVARVELSRQIDGSAVDLELQVALATLDYQNGSSGEGKERLKSLADDQADQSNIADEQLARILIDEGDHAAAWAIIASMLADDPSHAEGLALRAVIRLGRDEVDLALIDVRSALDEDPGNPEFLALAAAVLERRGDTALANDNFLQAVRASRLEPGIVLQYARFLNRHQNLEDAEALLTEAAARHPRDARLVAELIETNLRQDKWADVQSLTQLWHDLGGEPERAQRWEAGVLVGEGRFEEAIAFLSDLDASPRTEDLVVSGIVEAHVQSGNPAKAEAYLEDRLEADPGNIEATLLAGVLAAQRGDLAVAEERLKTVIAQRPDHHSGYQLLGQIYIRQDQHDRAIAVLSEGIDQALDPDSLRLMRAMTYELSQDVEAAYGEYAFIVEQDPSSLIAVNNMVDLVAHNFREDAEKFAFALNAAGQLKHSAVPEFQDTYGWMLYLQGDYEQALRNLKSAAEARPNNPWIQFHLGMTLAKLGNAEESKKHLNNALRLGGEDFEPVETITAMIDKVAEVGNETYLSQ